MRTEVEATVPKVQKFEDLIAWQRARELVREIYLATSREDFSKDFGLKGQIQRAAVSMMSNIAEGFERGKRTEFHQFLCVDKASCAEVRSQLYVALDAGYIDAATFARLLQTATEVSRIVGRLRVAVARQRDQEKA